MLRRALAGLALTVWLASPAQAHKVNLFAFPEGDRVWVEGYFSDGRKPKESAVTVFDGAGNVLLAGKTDEGGRFVFDRPASQGGLRITLNAGMGHKAEYTLSAAEPGGLPASSPARETRADTGEQPPPRDALKGMIREAVGEALMPLARTVSEMKAQRSLSDIIGGIGFIFGIMGLFFYYKARKVQDDTRPRNRERGSDEQ